MRVRARERAKERESKREREKYNIRYINLIYTYCITQNKRKCSLSTPVGNIVYMDI